MASPITMALSVRLRVAHHLKRYREMRGYTQQEAAAAYQRTPRSGKMRASEISRYENAHVRPSEPKLLRFAEVYGVDVSAFYAPIPEEEEGAA